jgi:hypothetical protein
MKTVIAIDSRPLPLSISPRHAPPQALLDRWLRFPRIKSSRRTSEHFSIRPRLRCLHQGPERSTAESTNATPRLLRHANSLAPRSLARTRRFAIGIHAVVVGDACPALARRPWNDWHGQLVSGPLQVVSGARGRPLLDGLSICRAKPTASKSRDTSRALEMVEPLDRESRWHRGFTRHWPVPRPAEWVSHVNSAQTEAELNAVRRCVVRSRPFGGAEWTLETAKSLGLETSLRIAGKKGPGVDCD